MIIHLTGTDTFRSAQRLRELREAFITRHDPQGFNTVTLDGETATPEELHGALTATGFFAAKRFVALDRYSPSGPITPEKMIELVKPAAEKTSDVILVVRELSTEKKSTRAAAKKKTTTPRKKMIETPLLPNEKLETFPALNETQATAWVNKMARDINGSFAPPAVQRLVAICDRDTWRMAAEIAKLVAHAGGASVTVADVEALVKSEASSDIFALTDALGQRQNARVLELLHRELESGTNEFSLIATLAGHIRNLYHVKQAQAQNLTPSAMAQELTLHPFVVQKSLAQATRFTAEELRGLHHRLLEIDQDLKTFPLDVETLLDLISVKR